MFGLGGVFACCNGCGWRKWCERDWCSCSFICEKVLSFDDPMKTLISWPRVWETGNICMGDGAQSGDTI